MFAARAAANPSDLVDSGKFGIVSAAFGAHWFAADGAVEICRLAAFMAGTNFHTCYLQGTNDF
jgi:hypothetical protein